MDCSNASSTYAATGSICSRWGVKLCFTTRHFASCAERRKSRKGTRDKAKSLIHKGSVHPAQTIRSP
ncbi:hypothetical protein DBB31_18250 [Burkholderia multivorans]|nr:hypothetical protein DBB31_18250 [Burkholderia multivorans]